MLRKRRGYVNPSPTLRQRDSRMPWVLPSKSSGSRVGGRGIDENRCVDGRSMVCCVGSKSTESRPIWERQSAREGFPDKVMPRPNFGEQIGGSPMRK